MVLECTNYNLLPLPSYYAEPFRNSYCQDANHVLVVPPSVSAPSSNYAGFSISRCMPSEAILVRAGSEEANFTPSALLSLSLNFSRDVTAFSLRGTGAAGAICLNRPFFVAQDRAVTDLTRVREMKAYFASATCENDIGRSQCMALSDSLRIMLQSSTSFRDLYPEETPFMQTFWGDLLKFTAIGAGLAVMAKIVDHIWPWNGPRGGSGGGAAAASSPSASPAVSIPAPPQRIASPETSPSPRAFNSTQNWVEGGLFAGAAATLTTVVIRTVLPALARGAAILILSLW